MADIAPVVSAEEVYDLLRNVAYNTSLRPVHWVMNLEWYKAIRRSYLRPDADDDARDEAKWKPTHVDMLLGYYVTVTEDGGTPHLVDGQRL